LPHGQAKVQWDPLYLGNNSLALLRLHSLDATLVSNNLAHFPSVRGLKTVSWLPQR